MPKMWKAPRRTDRFVASLCLAVAGTVTAACDARVITNLERLVEARRLAAELHVQFTMLVDAGNRAVMADTDDASVAFVREANEAAGAAERDRAALDAVLRGLGYTEETSLLDAFGGCYREYSGLDKDILGLAVENTNLRAQRLSFTSAQQEADAFRDALDDIRSSIRGNQAAGADALVANAIAAVREIQVLQAPHIAASDEVAMTQLEQRASQAEASARRALRAIAALIPQQSRQLDLASGALDRFMQVNQEIVDLSRRNTNVRSLALSLGKKRTLTARCEDNLRAIQEALAARHFAATR